MNKMERFKPEVIKGVLWLIQPMTLTRTPHYPACFCDVRVKIGENGEAHTIEARIVSVTRGADRVKLQTELAKKTVRCTTFAEMEREAAKLNGWGANWKNKKLMEGWKEMEERARKEGRVKSGWAF